MGVGVHSVDTRPWTRHGISTNTHAYVFDPPPPTMRTPTHTPAHTRRNAGKNKAARPNKFRFSSRRESYDSSGKKCLIS